MLKNFCKKAKTIFFIDLLFLFFIITSLLLYSLVYKGKVYPGIFIAGIDISGKNLEEASKLISLKITPPEKIFLSDKEEVFEKNLEEFEFRYKYLESVSDTYFLTRTGNIVYDFGKRVSLLFKNDNLGLKFSINEAKLDEFLLSLSNQLTLPSQKPKAEISKDQILIDKGQKGYSPDTTLLRAYIGQNLAFVESEKIEIPFKETGFTLNEMEAQNFKERAERILDKSIILKFQEQKFEIKNQELVFLLDAKEEYSRDYLTEKISEIFLKIDSEPQNSVFVFKEGKVAEFVPSKDGYKVEKETLKTMLTGNLRTLENSQDKTVSFEIPVIVTTPKVQTKDVNNLGIKELMGKGSSKFVGSIPNRIYNIELASSKFKGVLLAPGEIFSFNQILGDVSTLTGYKQAFIIKEGKTILGDGGGVCQVSTTLFRAVLNAGLPIVERKAHSYRVGYYEQDSLPGLDATVYAPSADLKFKNDTPAHILIQPVFSSKAKTLTFEIYGTNDNRKVFLGKPKVSDITSPPADLYLNDPALPQGQVKQIDFKAWGAKVVFDYKVVKNNETTFEKTFVSNYRPWQAVFLKGVGVRQ